MFLTKLKLAAAALLLIATGSAVLVNRATAQKPAACLGAAQKAKPPAAGATSVPDDAIVLEMLESAWVYAINCRETAIVSRIIADDFASIDSTGRWVTRADYVLTVLNGAVPAEEIVQDEIKVRLFGDSAVVTSRIKLKTTLTWQGLSNVYVKQQGRWRCVASHATWILPRQTPPPSQTTNRHEDTRRPQEVPLVEQLRVSQEKLEIAELQNALLREDLKKERASVHSNRQAGARSPDAAVPASGPPASGAAESNVRLLHQVLPTVLPAQRAEDVIRPRFECLVERVYVKAGQTVKKGAALVDVSSIELAAAKNDYLTKEVQLKHHQRILGMRRKLFEEKAISEQVWTDTQNDEEKSKLEFQVARDKLKYFGLDDEAIGLVGKEDGGQKARMTLRAPADGMVIKVEVEPGNLYDMKSALLILNATTSEQSTQP